MQGRCSWASYKERGTGESYRPTWVVAVPAGSPPRECVPLVVVSKAGRTREVFVHATSLGERVINGIAHTLHRVDDDPFGVGGYDDLYESDIMPDLGCK